MPIFQALFLLLVVAGLAVLTERWRLHPFIALVAATLGFGFAADMSLSYIANAFGTGFAQTLSSLGLIATTAGIMTAIASGSGARERIAAATAGLRRRLGAGLLAPLGLVAGLGASPAAAFAVTSALREAVAGPTKREAGRAAAALGLTISASHGLLLPAPVMVAATVIVGADWVRVLSFGAPVALLTIAVGLVFARRAAGRLALEETPPASTGTGIPPAPVPGGGRVAAVLFPVTLILVLLLIVQSLGDIPSEPFGGGPTRTAILAAGRPLVLLLVGGGILFLAAWRWDRRTWSEQGWAGQGVANAAGILLLIGSSGGLQKVLQETGMPELLAEGLLTWQVGLVVPFLAAAVVKTLQGSSLVAAITAAGMTQPLLGALELDSDSGRALAALAVGAGAMTLTHINDGFFWLVTAGARVRPLQGLGIFSLGTLAQGLFAFAVLLVAATIAR